MKARDAVVAVCLLVGVSACAAGAAGGDTPDEEEHLEETPLDLTVEWLDVLHGALRLQASMVDGGTEVSVRLGGACAPHEVGGGLSTLSTLVWTLGEDDVAGVLGCGLVVRVRVRDGVRTVYRVAELDVEADLARLESDDVEGGPQVQSVATTAAGVDVVFAPVRPGARVVTGDSILDAAPCVNDEAQDTDEVADDDGARRFIVPTDDFARSVLRRNSLRLDGSSFAASLSVGGFSLQDEPAEIDESAP